MNDALSNLIGGMLVLVIALVGYAIVQQLVLVTEAINVQTECQIHGRSATEGCLAENMRVTPGEL